MQLYNTLSHKKEPFSPITPGKVGIYTCGITAYDYCHIGHARSAIVFDVLVRYLRHSGYEVTFVRNFTDVDDKIIVRAQKDGVSSTAIAERFIKAFHEDMDRLGVLRADVEPKATEHIDDMISLCRELIAREHAYDTPSGDVYFRVRSFDGYGKLSSRNVDDMRAGARILPGEKKEDPLDFALWKAAKPDEPYWESPWGRGRPGWHIECSAMSERYLSLPLDIHGGGLDLIFPHHENEIAQTEAAKGKELARYWVHNGFVQMETQKMSKSLGNFKTIRDILEHHMPEVLRFFLLGRHYRTPIDFTVDAMDDAEKNLKRLYETLALVGQACLKPLPKGGQTPEDITAEYERHRNGWDDAMRDDLNTAAALGHMNGAVHLAGRILEDKSLRNNAGCRLILENLRKTVAGWSLVFGVLGLVPVEFLAELKIRRVKRRGIDTAQVEALLEERRLARKNKDFTASDRIREHLAELGVEVRDTSSGAEWDVI